MPDPRITKLAKVLINYSLKIQPGEQLLIQTSPLADELTMAVYEEAIKAGAHVITMNQVPGLREIFFKNASDEQLEYIAPVQKMMMETFDAFLHIQADSNTRSMSGVEPQKMAQFGRANAEMSKIMMQRSATGDLKWCMTVYPTNAMAQEADMSLADYTEFVYGAGMLNEDDPTIFWQEEAKRQHKLIDWMKGRKEVVLKGANIDITMSIDGRTFIESAGTHNFPSGEVFTSPIENSAEGWVRFKYPAIRNGQEIHDIELWFEKGKVVKEKAGKNQELLTALLDTDKGSRFLGELGIGTNYGIQR
ncbi:MAG: aminopeptidase, partial [Anaerolineae bacterium]|nr:aminopeptidase [Anaerolineae bacterium]